MQKLRKLLVIGVMVLTVLGMTGLVAPKANAAASAGDLIKMAGNSSVYYLGSDGKRYVFPNSTTYFSWYNDFSGVVTIPASELQSYPLGGNVTMRPGTKLVKITTDPSVYAVEPNGSLRKIQSEAQAAALYGTDWAKKVVDVPDAFFVNYQIGAALPTGSIPAGSLVKNSGSASVYYYDGTNYRNIASEAAFNANRFNWSNILTVSNSITAGGTAVSGAETALVNVAQNGGQGPVVTGSGLMVSLSSATPTGTGIPAGSPVDFLKINLTAANDGAVNVNAITLTAYDLGVATNLDDVTFYDNGVKVGTSKNFTSDRVATFNFATPVTVAAGTTKTLTVKATVATGQTGNYSIGVAKASDVMATAASVTGSFPVVGNSMSVVSGTNIGTVGMSGVIGTDTTNNFGEDNVLLAGFDLTANNEPVLIQTLRFRNGGTDAAGIVDNLKLYIDGTEVASGTYADRYATFSLTNYRIAKSDTVSVEVRGDLGVSNVSDKVELYVRDKNDFVFLGQDFGFPVQLTDAAFALLDATTEGISVSFSTGDFTVDMDKSSSGTPAKDVKPGDNDVVLATIVLKSNGENATIEKITDGTAGAGTTADEFELQGTGLGAGEIENVELVDVATGGVYDVTATRVSDTEWNLSMTDEITLVKGISKKFYVRADMSDTVGAEIDENDTVKVVLDAGAMTVTGDESNASITDITPSSVTSAIVTVKSASLSWTPVAINTQTVVGGATDIVVYQATLKAGTADGVKLQAVTLSTNGADAAFSDSNITKLDMYLNNNLIKSVSNGITETSGGADATVTFNSLNAANSTIPAGQTYTLTVKASFASTLAGGTFDVEVESADDVTSRSVVGNNLVTETGVAGVSGTITATTSGTIKVELLTSNVKADENIYLLAGAATPTDRYLGELKFTTANEPVKVKKLSLNNTGTMASDDIASIKLVKSDGTVVATDTVEADGDVIFDPFDYVLPADQATSLFIMVEARGMNVAGDSSSTADYNETLIYNIPADAGSITAEGANSGEALTLAVSGDGTIIAGEWSQAATVSKTATIVGSVLNTVVNDLANGQLTGGTAKTLGKYKFVFNNGNNRNAANEELKAILDNMVVTFSKAANVAITNVKANIDGTATKVTANTLSAAMAAGAGNTTGTATWNAGTLAGLADGGKVDGEVTLVITGDIALSTDDGEYVQTSFVDLSGTGADDDFQFIGNGETAGAVLTNMLLPVTEVVGATLSE